MGKFISLNFNSESNRTSTITLGTFVRGNEKEKIFALISKRTWRKG